MEWMYSSEKRCLCLMKLCGGNALKFAVFFGITPLYFFSFFIFTNSNLLKTKDDLPIWFFTYQKYF